MNVDQQTLATALEYLDKIGNKIGMTAETIWPWLVKQQYVYFGTALTILTVGLVCIPFALHISNKYHPWEDKLYGTEDVDFVRVFRCGILIVAFAATVIGLIATIFNTPRLFNPEFHALSGLMDLIK